MAKRKIQFEDHLNALQEIITKIDGGDISLDEHIALYEEGMKLVQKAQTALSALEEKVAQLDANLLEQKNIGNEAS